MLKLIRDEVFTSITKLPFDAIVDFPDSLASE